MPNLLNRLIGRLRHRPVEDVEPDSALANSRATGGGDRQSDDAVSTTGVGNTGEYVGRASGQDEGFAGETGAEVRSTDDPV